VRVGCSDQYRGSGVAVFFYGNEKIKVIGRPTTVELWYFVTYYRNVFTFKILDDGCLFELTANDNEVWLRVQCMTLGTRCWPVKSRLHQLKARVTVGVIRESAADWTQHCASTTPSFIKLHHHSYQNCENWRNNVFRSNRVLMCLRRLRRRLRRYVIGCARWVSVTLSTQPITFDYRLLSYSFIRFSRRYDKQWAHAEEYISTVCHWVLCRLRARRFADKIMTARSPIIFFLFLRKSSINRLRIDQFRLQRAVLSFTAQTSAILKLLFVCNSDEKPSRDAEIKTKGALLLLWPWSPVDDLDIQTYPALLSLHLVTAIPSYHFISGIAICNCIAYKNELSRSRKSKVIKAKRPTRWDAESSHSTTCDGETAATS